MKKLLYTSLVVIIILSSCKKEEASNNNLNVNISNMTGIWEATSLILDGDNLSSLATILYWLKADMTIEENYQYNNSTNINDNTGTWELSGSNLIIYWDTGEKVTYQINSLNNTTVSLILVEWLNDSGYIQFETGSVTLVKQ
mgnify:CR=1 FL=1|tara:strand:- start:32 stop:457 length:426 start_codon:yes stop_codon:yes gene_type:complete